MATTASELAAVLPCFPAKDLSTFHVESLLGGGGFSHVVLARDAARAEWALKLIPAQGATCLDDVDVTPLLLSEARIHLLLSREPSVLPCLEAFKSVYMDERGGGRPATYMAVLRMPVAACSVEEWLFSVAPLRAACQGPPQLQVDEREVLGVWLQMVNAVHRCHVHGVVHKDIKLPNFLMDSRGRVQIMDFGLAQMEGVTPRVVVGTPWTMSPAALKHGDDGRAGDWWSLGVVLYQLMQGGAWPFKQYWWPWQKGGGERMEAAIRRAVLAGRIAFRDPSSVSEPVKALIRGLLQPDPNRRWQLRQVLASEAVSPALLRSLAEKFPELGPDMQALLQMQSRARDVMSFGSDGGVGAGGMAAVAGSLLRRGVAAAAEGGLHWPAGLHLPGGRGHGGADEEEGSYQPLLGDGEEGADEREGLKALGAQATIARGGVAGVLTVEEPRAVRAHVTPVSVAAGHTLLKQHLRQSQPQQQQQLQQQQEQQRSKPSDSVHVDDLLMLLPDEAPQPHPAPPTALQAIQAAASPTTTTTAMPPAATASACSTSAADHGPVRHAATTSFASDASILDSGRQGSGPLMSHPYRPSPRGSRTSLHDLFGAGSGPPPQLPSPLGSAVDLIGTTGGGGGQPHSRSANARRHSWMLPWQSGSQLQQHLIDGGGSNDGSNRGGVGGGGSGTAASPSLPLQLPQSSWVPPPPEVLAPGKFDRRSDAGSPKRTSSLAPAGSRQLSGSGGVGGRENSDAAAVGRSWRSSSLTRPPGLGHTPSQRLLAQAMRLFTVCLRRPGVRHEADEEQDECNALAGQGRGK